MAEHDEKETLHLIRELSKADDSDRQLEILNQISNLKMTYDILCSTKIGGVIKPLKKSQDMKLSQAAMSLLKEWRAIADANANKVIRLHKVGGGGVNFFFFFIYIYV